MSWSLLERFIESDHFNNDPSLAVAYLARYAHHVGIQYVLCTKLRGFAYEEIEFYLPQLCHLLVSVDNESMALEEFIIDLCQESVSGALLTFWLFQTHLHDLSYNPQSNAFKTCRRIFNKVQHIVFGTSSIVRPDKIQENVLPVTVLASIVLASVATPFLSRHLGPLAVAQARKPRPTEDTISEAPPVQATQLTRSQTVGRSSTNKSKRRSYPGHTRNLSNMSNASTAVGDEFAATQRPSSQQRKSFSKNALASAAGYRSSIGRANTPSPRSTPKPFPESMSTPSLQTTSLDPPRINAQPKLSFQEARRNTYNNNSKTGNLDRAQKIHMLRANYFRSETQFLTALQDISVRLVAVPKPARLSALRAELALIARDLPAEVDIPLICQATLEDGIPSQSKHHRVVRISPAESTSLNSAERVPYLLMLEVLREDFDFNPDSEQNKRLLEKLMGQTEAERKRLFDTSNSTPTPTELNPSSNFDSELEPAMGDLSSFEVLKDFPEDDVVKATSSLANGSKGSPLVQSTKNSNGANTVSSLSLLSTPKTSDLPSSRASSPGPRRLTIAGTQPPVPGPDQPDFSALATHMRTAAQMLAQLDISGAKRPRHEVEAIKSKIIASMQHLEEENFVAEDIPPTASFDTIIANVPSPALEEDSEYFEEGTSTPENNMNTGAGAARMENDQVIGGVRRRGDRDDPSAATFGEDWNSKKERIRRSSPYGWMKNWDLISVIVKTGSDLRQELFATQLIRICDKIWDDADVPVWIKHMRILVTGESSGLIETITNGVSLHSLKRSLTLASIAAGTNPRKRFATLKDHFIKTFGEENSEAYKSAVDNFMRSLAAYSILCYVIQLKDRHNGNVLIDSQGHIIHIDFGFMLSNSPGSVGFEAAPFKLTQDYVDVLGGINSPGFEGFKALCKQAFQALRKNAENIVMVVDLMSKESKMACFSWGSQQTVASLRQRFQLHLSREEAETFVETDLIGKSLGGYYTRLYDTFQYRTQGIY